MDVPARISTRSNHSLFWLELSMCEPDGSVCVHTCDTDVQEKKVSVHGHTHMHTHGHTHGRTLAIHTRPYKGKTVTRPYRKNASTAVPGKSWHGRVHKKNADTAVTQLYSNKYLISYISCTFKRPVMFYIMNVKNGSKDLKSYPQISRRVRDTLARLF